MARTEEKAPARAAGHHLVWLTGGMLTMSLLLAALSLSNVSATANHVQDVPQNSSAAARPFETGVSTAASQWIALLDNGQWDESWQAAAIVFKAQLTSEKWTPMIQSLRTPLGRVSSRALQSAVRTSTLPGAPAGDYQVLQFKTRFATKPDAIETIVLSREKVGWRVSGYFIR